MTSTPQQVTPVLGMAQYQARWIARSFLVRLTATGILPCSNFHAQLERAPQQIVPPMWNMVFYTQDWCEKGLKHFECSAVMPNETGARAVLVQDATGEHQVPVLPAFDLADRAETVDQPPPPPPLALGPDGPHLVYAHLPRPQQGHWGCLILPQGSAVTATHYLAFGPAPKSECEAFVIETCRPPPADTAFRSGEIPWPLLR